VAPDSLIVSLTEPFPGPVNDWNMYRCSGVEKALRVLMEGYENLYIYSDPAYQGSFGVAVG
jgi:hypothetical protein